MSIARDPIIIDNKTHLVIKQAVSRELCEFISQYAILKSQVQPNAKKGILINVHREYGDLVMETILSQLTPLIEKATGLSLWPTLSFYYVYKTGNQLQKHHDRSSCEIVAGLCIGADENYKKTQGSWPLILEFAGVPTPIALDYGDILIFKGSVTEHWREAFTGEWFISAIFGYVDKNGPFAFQKFDQRRSLGRAHIGMFNWSFGYLKNDIKKRLQAFFNKKQ